MRTGRILLLSLLALAIAAPTASALAAELAVEVSSDLDADGEATSTVEATSFATGDLTVDASADTLDLDLRAAGVGVSTGPTQEAATSWGTAGTSAGDAAFAGELSDRELRTAAAAAGAASLAVAAAWVASRFEVARAFLGRGGALLVAPLYSRIGRSELLENETRSRVYDVVRENPGLSMKEVAEAAGIGWGTVVYHLERLEKNQYVASRKSAGNRRYFAVGHVPREDRAALAVLRKETPKRIATYLVGQPGANQQDVCEALGIAASTAHKHLGRMEKADLVRREREWRSVHYHPTEALHSCLAGTVAPEPATAPAAQAAGAVPA